MSKNGELVLSELKKISIKYIVISLVLSILIPLCFCLLSTYNFDVKFSCNKREDLCKIERTNFVGMKASKEIPQLDILEAQRNINKKFPAGLNHSIVLKMRSGKDITIYDMNTRFSRPIEDMDEKAEQINLYLNSKQTGYNFHHLNNFGFHSILTKALLLLVWNLLIFFCLIPLILGEKFSLKWVNSIKKFVFKNEKI